MSLLCLFKYINQGVLAELSLSSSLLVNSSYSSSHKESQDEQTEKKIKQIVFPSLAQFSLMLMFMTLMIILQQEQSDQQQGEQKYQEHLGSKQEQEFSMDTDCLARSWVQRGEGVSEGPRSAQHPRKPQRSRRSPVLLAKTGRQDTFSVESSFFNG